MQNLRVEQDTVDLQSVFANLPGSHVAVLPDAPKFTITAASEGYLRDTARSRQELLGKGLFEAFPNNPDDPHRTSEKTVAASLEYALTHKEPHHLPLQRYDIAKKDGSFEERWWLATNKPVLNKDGTVNHLVHSVEDVTEKRKADRQAARLREMEKAYDFFMHAPVIVGIVRGDDYTIELANESLLEVWGRSAKVIGKPLLEAIPELKDQGFIGLLNTVRTTGEPFRAYEMPTTLRRGEKEEVRYIDFVYQPYYKNKDEAKASAVIAVGHDVTERVLARNKVRESEEKYRSLFHSMEQGFCVIELVFDEKCRPLDYVFLEVNPVFETQTGMTNAVGKTIRNLVPQIEQYWIETYGNVAFTGESVRVVEKSETLNKWFDVYAFRIGDAESRKVGIFFTDVTGQKGSEETRRKTEALQAFLLKLSDALRPLQDPAEIQHRAASTLGEHLGADRVGYAEDGGDGQTVVVTRNYTRGVAGIEGRYRYEDYGAALLAELRAGRTVVRPDIQNDPTLTASEKVAHAALQLGATVNVPLVKEGQLLAILFVHCKEPHRWTEEELALVKETAERTWAAVERARTEKALRLSEERLQKVLSIETVGVIYFNLEGNIHGANAAFERMSGYTEKDIVGGKLRWDQMTPPEFMEATLKSRDEFLTKGQNTPYEKQYIRTDGSRWWGLFAGKRLSDSECVEFVVDITKTKQAEEDLEEKVQERTRELESQKALLDNILANSSNGISVTEMIRDESGNVVDAATILANDAAVKYTGLPRDIYLGKTATEIDPGILLSPYGQICLHTLETGEPSFTQYHLDATGRWLELTISKMDDDHLIHIFTDVTPIKEAQLQLERSLEDLKRTNQNLEEFAYAASHDMKEPIRKIHLFADRLKMELADLLTEEQARLFGRMERASQRMGALIDDLLTYSHVSRGIQDVETIDLNQKLQAVLEDLEVLIDEKGAEVKVEHLPTVKGHRRQLAQLFQNLIGNALKYSKPGEVPRIQISAKKVHGRDTPLPLSPEDAAKAFYQTEIRDNGIGFAQEDAERIFNVFTRLHGNSEYRGTGVGLSIVRRVAQNHGGFVWAESEEGKGSVFNLLLPAENETV